MATLREILETLRQTYCGKIGCEYMNIQVPEQKRWLQQRMEPEANNWPLDRETRVRMLRNLIAAEEFEHFLHSRFVGQKRFALEGARDGGARSWKRCWSAPPITTCTRSSSAWRIAAASTCWPTWSAKPSSRSSPNSKARSIPASTQGSGDVKYHLGATRHPQDRQRARRSSSPCRPNPSHLEAVDPVVEGIVRPKQDRLGDTARERVIPVLVHGDAAFAGQGVVAETLNLSQLDGYSTGGTIHLIINNQIGFTTLPDESRSTPYSTDVARGIQAPIFHVNGDDPAGCDPRGADRLRLPPEVQEGRGDRHDLLSPPWP